MKHLFVAVLLVVLLATPAAGFSGWGESSSGWGEEEVEEEIIVPEPTPEPTPEEEPEPTEEPPQVPNAMQFLIDNGYVNAPSGFGEPEMIVDPVADEPIKTVEVVKEVVVEKVIVYETVYIEKPVDNMEWWQTMEAPAEEKVGEKPIVKGISTPDTGGSGLFWLGLAAVILGVAIVARIEGRGE